MTASSPGRITSATTSTSDRWALWPAGKQYRDRKFRDQFGGAHALAAGKFTLKWLPTRARGVRCFQRSELSAYRRDRRDAVSARRADGIVGISRHAIRPPQARREKPRVSAFTSANIDKILALRPDLVLTFSDL
jgi:hypothetical protein